MQIDLAFDENTFPPLSKILRHLIMIPATTAIVESARSLFKFVKNDLHSALSEEHIIALMLLSIHQYLASNYDQVTDDFARRKPPKMLPVNALGWRILITLVTVYSLWRIYVNLTQDGGGGSKMAPYHTPKPSYI